MNLPLNDNQVPWKGGQKYEMVEKKTRSNCKVEYILSIFNVTENDGGSYSCHCLCENKYATKAPIDLKVFDDLPTCKNLKNQRQRKYIFIARLFYFVAHLNG